MILASVFPASIRISPASKGNYERQSRLTSRRDREGRLGTPTRRDWLSGGLALPVDGRIPFAVDVAEVDPVSVVTSAGNPETGHAVEVAAGGELEVVKRETLAEEAAEFPFEKLLDVRRQRAVGVETGD